MGIREDKGAVVEDIKGKLSAAKAAILTDYRGMDVAEATALRKKLRAAKVEYRVLKNTLVNRAAQEIGYTGPVGLMCYGIPDNTREHLSRSMKTWKSWQEP